MPHPAKVSSATTRKFAPTREVKYQGIRPAPGYPSQPDHREKKTLFDLLEVWRWGGVWVAEDEVEKETNNSTFLRVIEKLK